MRAILMHALAVHDQTVFLQLEAQFASLDMLSLFDDIVCEFRDMSAFQADHMVVVVAALKLKDGVATFEMMPLHQACSFELGQHTVNRRQSDILV